MEQFERGTTLRRVATSSASPRLKWVVVLVAVLLSGFALASGVSAKEATGPAAGLPDGYDSTTVAQLESSFPSSDVAPAIVVVDRDGEALTADDTRAVAALAQRLQGFSVVEGAPLTPVAASDGEASIIAVPLSTAVSQEKLDETVTELRAAARDGLPGDLRAQVTGGPAFQVDLASVFDGADIRLLLTTAGVVALLLLVTYRSPWLWLVPLTVVGVADRVAATLVSVGTQVFGFTVDPSTVGITSVLVFGAGTNYALLLIARYREELRRTEDRQDAMRHALGQAGPAVLASSGTVVLALLALTFAVTPSNRSLGYAGAIGIATAVVYALVVLPAAMVLFGRGLFWPFVPRVGQPDPTRTGPWSKVGGAVVRRPVPILVGSVLVLAVLASGVLGARLGLSQNEQFRTQPESVQGQKVLASAFPAGSSEPTTVVAPASRVAEVTAAVRGVEGVDDVATGAEADGRTTLSVVLAADPESAASSATIERIRSTLDGSALVGGPDAQALDERDAASHDQRVVIPVVLAIVLVVLLLLLRSAVAAVTLLATVVASYGASLGASWWAFTHLFDFPALDLQVPLLAFLFLVALGVDYNIFLTTRAREEARSTSTRGSTSTREAIATALAVTGGVITSAGILLAAVFTVLGVLPLITLTQIGIIVGFGVLLDTLLVRTVLVPAAVAVLGDRFWWPGNPRRGDHAAAPSPHEEPVPTA
ncbi:MMPL family transporter [Solicola sp. PLA-1-18]|uniref:MMPL family transporter n=1 Tax=Solicola sp. PLA-1-18 TaxID=3380532 RepID=UPI003B7B785C